MDHFLLLQSSIFHTMSHKEFAIVECLKILGSVSLDPFLGLVKNVLIYSFVERNCAINITKPIATIVYRMLRLNRLPKVYSKMQK